MPHAKAQSTLIRLTGFAALWVIALTVRNIHSGDARWVEKVQVAGTFAIPSILLLLLVQRITRYRISWPLELFGMPFLIAGLIYAAIAIRRKIGA